jgi:hypothetical protein
MPIAVLLGEGKAVGPRMTNGFVIGDSGCPFNSFSGAAFAAALRRSGPFSSMNSMSFAIEIIDKIWVRSAKIASYNPCEN